MSDEGEKGGGRLTVYLAAVYAVILARDVFLAVKSQVDRVTALKARVTELEARGK